MIDLILGIGVVCSLGVGGYGVWLARSAGAWASQSTISLEQARADMATLDAKVRDLQSILTAAPPDMIAASVIADQWRSEMLALPEGSPKRQAYESRLKQLGVS